MISKQIFSLNFMFLCSFIEELCTKEENYRTGCFFNFEHQCILSDYNSKNKFFNKEKKIKNDDLIQIRDNSGADEAITIL